LSSIFDKTWLGDKADAFRWDLLRLAALPLPPKCEQLGTTEVHWFTLILAARALTGNKVKGP